MSNLIETTKVRITPADKLALRRAAEQHHMTVSAYIRFLVRNDADKLSKKTALTTQNIA